jgi:phosphate transport system permease protein
MKRTLYADSIATGALWAIAILVVAILGGIILHFLLASVGTLSLNFLFGDPSDTSVGGIGPLLWNSVYILVLTLLITVPLGILGGIYMAEYAGQGRVPNLIRLSQELISSVPSIVVGLFGLALFVNATHWSFTALAGALALTVFNLPLLMRLTEQALRAVPAAERDGSLALGTTKWQTIRHVVLPLAIPGIVTGIILTAGRIFGEAAALLFTAGLATPAHYDYTNFNFGDPRSPWSPFHPATTLSVYISKLNSEGLGSFVRQVSDSSAAVLVLMVLVFNLGARGLGRLLKRRVGGAV